MRKLLRNKKGQGLVEYGILVGGVALVALAATAILGHKTTDLIGSVASALPGAHDDAVGPIVSGILVDITTVPAEGGGSGLVLDITSTDNSLASNLGFSGESALVVEPQ